MPKEGEVKRKNKQGERERNEMNQENEEKGIDT